MQQYGTDYSHNKKNAGECTYVNFFQKKSNWFTKYAKLQNCQEYSITGVGLSDLQHFESS